MIELFHPIPDQRWMSRHLLVSAVFCYMFSCVAAWLLLPLAVRTAQSPIRTAIASICYVTLVAAIAGFVADVQLSRFPVPLPAPKRTLLLAFLPVIPWLAPVVLLCLRGGLPAALAAGIFAAASARLFRKWGISFDRGITEVPGTRPGGFLLALPELAPAPVHPLGLTASVCLAYGGVAAALSGHNETAVFCTAMSCFALSWMEAHHGAAQERSFTANVRSFLFHAFCAVWVTFALLLPRFGPFHVGSGAAKQSKAKEADDPLSQLHSGIILWVPHKDPVPLKLHRTDDVQAQTKLRVSNLMSIPFSGEYWFFLWPMSRPPAGSLRDPGDPTTLHMTVHRKRPKFAADSQFQQRVGTRVYVSINFIVDT